MLRSVRNPALRAAGIDAAYALLDVERDVATCLRDPVPLLERIGEQIAYDHLS